MDPTETKIDPDGPFQVKLARSGRIVEVPAGTSVLDALRDGGVTIPSACEDGVCGTCETLVMAGIPDHRDQCMTAKEHAANDRFTPCCSRSRTAMLVVDR